MKLKNMVLGRLKGMAVVAALTSGLFAPAAYSQAGGASGDAVFQDGIQKMLVALVPVDGDLKKCSVAANCRKLVTAVRALPQLAQLKFVVNPQSLVETNPDILPQDVADAIKADQSSLPVFGAAGITSSPAASRTVGVTDQGGVVSDVDTARKITWGNLLGSANAPSTSSGEVGVVYGSRTVRTDEDSGQGTGDKQQAEKEATSDINKSLGSAYTPSPGEVFGVSNGDGTTTFTTAGDDADREVQEIISSFITNGASGGTQGGLKAELKEIAKDLGRIFGPRGDQSADAATPRAPTAEETAAVTQMLQHPQGGVKPGQVDPAFYRADESPSAVVKRPPTLQQQKIVSQALAGRAFIPQNSSRTGGDGGMQDPGGQTGRTPLNLVGGALGGGKVCTSRPGAPIQCQ